MKAAICTKYGPPEVLQIREVEKPVPNDDQVLIRIRATTVNSGDCRMRGFNVPFFLWIPMRLMLGIAKPKKPILGMSLAGIVEETGRDVSRFRKGDRVYASATAAYAQYRCMKDSIALETIPTGATFDEAAAMPFGGLSALYFLRKGDIGPGQRVLIYGASGAVGTAAVQIAKAYGAEVTGVCSTANLALVKSLGAVDVVDYTKENYANRSQAYDIVFDAVGKTSHAKSKKALKPGGRFVTVAAYEIAKLQAKDLLLLNELYESGRFRPVIDRSFPLDDIVEAHRYVDNGHKKGNVVLTVGE